MNDKQTIINILKRRKIAIIGSIVFLIVDLIYFIYALFTTVSITENIGFGHSVKTTVPLWVSNLTLYFGIYFILLTVCTGLFIYAKYSLGKAIKIYLEKPLQDISLNEFKNAKKAIFQCMKTGFPDDI